MQAITATATATPEQVANQIRNESVYGKIMSTNGKIFSVTLIKKDGTFRNMTARLGKRLGHELVNEEVFEKTSNTLRENLMIRVFDMQKMDYRTINCKTVIKFKCDMK